MRTSVSIPDETFEAAERLARRLGISRSQLYATAVKNFIAEHRGDRVTEALDRVYSDVDSGLEPGLARLQAASWSRDEW